MASLLEIYASLPTSIGLTISLGCVVVAVLIYRAAIGKQSWIRLLFVLATITVGYYSILYYAIDSLTGRGFDESVIYHYERGLAGAGVSDFWPLAVSVTVLFLASLLLGRWMYLWRVRSEHNPAVAFAFTLLLLAFLMHPFSRDIYQQGLVMEIIDEVGGKGDEEVLDFYQAYSDPRGLEVNLRKNVVFVYAESLERTYFESRKFPNVVEHLKEWEKRGLAFTNVVEANGTGWTMGGMVASQCGVPLVTMGSVRGVALSASDEFMPGAYCLGDILADAGFDLTYMGGASLEFVGKGSFYESHGFKQVIGLEQILESAPPDLPKTGWGIYDDTLLDLAFDLFLEKSAAGVPFGLFLLTLDTHHPYGNPSPACQEEGLLEKDNQILDAVRCSDWLLSEFLKKVHASEYAENTTIVVVSDHLAMPNTATDILDSMPRSNMFFILDSDVPAGVNQTLGTTFDVSATFLAVLGLEVAAFGIGRDLTAGDSLASRDSTFARTAYRRFMDAVRDLWLMPNLDEPLMVDINNQRVRFGHRNYRLPVLMSLDVQGQVERVFFQAIEGNHPISFTKHVGPALAVERCQYFEFTANVEMSGFTPDEICLYVRVSDEQTGFIKRLNGSEGDLSLDVSSLLSGKLVDGFESASLYAQGIVYSTGDLSRESGIFAETTTRFGRGITISGVVGPLVEKVSSIDPCVLRRNEDHSGLLAAEIEEYVANYDFLIVSVHHTATCNRDTMRSIFANANFEVPEHGEPYIAVVDAQGKIEERVGAQGGDLFVPISNLDSKGGMIQ